MRHEWASYSLPPAFQPSLRAQPLADTLRPVRHRILRRAQSVAMPAHRIDVQFYRNLRSVQRLSVDEGVLHLDRVILCHGDKGGWRLIVHLQFRGKLRQILFCREVSRIEENG